MFVFGWIEAFDHRAGRELFAEARTGFTGSGNAMKTSDQMLGRTRRAGAALTAGTHPARSFQGNRRRVGRNGARTKSRKAVGYVPQGLEKLGEIWKAPMPDYAFKGWEEKG